MKRTGLIVIFLQQVKKSPRTNPAFEKFRENLSGIGFRHFLEKSCLGNQVFTMFLRTQQRITFSLIQAQKTW